MCPSCGNTPAYRNRKSAALETVPLNYKAPPLEIKVSNVSLEAQDLQGVAREAELFRRVGRASGRRLECWKRAKYDA